MEEQHTRRTRTLHHLASSFAKAPVKMVRDERSRILTNRQSTTAPRRSWGSLTVFGKEPHTSHEAMLPYAAIVISTHIIHLTRAQKRHTVHVDPISPSEETAQDPAAVSTPPSAQNPTQRKKGPHTATTMTFCAIFLTRLSFADIFPSEFPTNSTFS